jgi:hypothetical protein
MTFFLKKLCIQLLTLFCFSFVFSTISLSQQIQNKGNGDVFAPTDLSALENDPIAFSPSYLGLSLNQNRPWSYGESTWSDGGPSWGAEYRFFYKDKWTLSLSGSFKNLKDLEHETSPLFSISQESARLMRIYHPLYIAVGGKLSYLVPVRKISIPYEREQSRSIDTGASIGVSAFYMAKDGFVVQLSASRWRSLTTLKRQGIEIAITALAAIR